MPPTPFMGLVLPTVGVTLGPEWATEVNAAFSVIDSHNHTTGNGVPVPSSGLNINTDLPFNSVNATGLRSTRYINNGSPLGGVSDLTCVYVSGGNLYYNNAVGNQVQITQGAGLDASTVGGFGGDYGTSTASAFYTSATSTFTFWQAPNQSAIMDMGPLVLHPTTTIAFGVTFKAPDTLSTSYQWTLPGAGPIANSIIVTDSSGNLGYAPSNSTITVSSGSVAVATSGVTQNELEPRTSPGATAGLGEIAFSGATSGSTTTIGPSTIATVSLVSKGRPVLVFLNDSGSTGTSAGFIQSTGGTLTTVQFYIDGVITSAQTIPAGSISLPLSAFSFFDYAVAAGTHTYDFKIQIVGGGQTVTWHNLALLAYEI